MHYRWGKTAAKKVRGHFKQCESSQNRSATLAVAGWKDNRAVYGGFSRSFKPNRLVRRWNNAEKSIFKNNS